MADKPTTTDAGTDAQYNSSVLNDNFEVLNSAIEGCLGRGGTGESPNSMQGDLDMDLNKIQNLGAPTNATDAVRLVDIAGTDSENAALLRSELASAGNGEGASLIGVEDSVGSFTATDVEGVLTEVDTRIDTAQTTAENAAADLASHVADSDPHPQYLQDSIVKAWVNFDGTGTPSIRASFNVAGIVDNGTGDYTVVFENPLPDNNYSVVGVAGRDTAGTSVPVVYLPSSDTNSNLTTTTARINTGRTSDGTLFDCTVVSIAVFR